ncbi:MAG: MBG domain-containing protein, partial [Hominilimicola sp.]
TALVAYIGSKFEDTGFTVYNNDGNTVDLSSSDTVKRTITYDTVPSYDFSDFNNTTSKTDVKILTGSSGENVISILKDEKVRPGVYNIKYEYGSEIFAQRKLIVIPRLGDMNMDGYINSVDVSMYNRADKPGEDTLSGRLYLYRGMDLTQDGVVDENDENELKNRTESSVRLVYPDISVSETVTQSAYTPSEIPDNSKVQMYMEYLGKNNDDITNSANNLPSSAQESEQLSKDDIFWVGYRLDNTEAVDDLQKGIYSMTASINYDSRYVSPAVLLTENESADITDSQEQWLATLKKYNNIWDGYVYNGFTNSSTAYSANNSTAVTNLDSTAEIKTLIMDITSGETMKTLSDGDYILRIPFKVNIVPPEGRKVIEASLDANTFNITTGDNGITTREWDTSDTLSNNLMDIIDFRGSFSPEFVNEEPAASVNEYYNNAVFTYGDSLPIFSLNNLVTAGTLEGDLPEGVTYKKSLNRLIGTPSEAGTFVFYISSKKLSITIDKAPMKVTANDKTKMYGEDNPVLDFVYDESCIKTSVDTNGLESTGFTDGLSAPQLVCAADKTTEYGEEIPIVISGASSKNYYFEYVNGTLTVDEKRPITINEVKNIPICTSEMAYVNRDSFPFDIQAYSQNDDGTLLADGIINDDIVRVNYKTEYPNNTPAKNVTVSIKDMTVDEEYERSRNYTIGENKMTSSSQGEVLDKLLTGINVKQQPPRQYTYGQKYSYNKGVTNIGLSFDNTQTITGLCVGDMADYGITLEVLDKDGNVMNETISEDLKLTVPKHNGMVVTLVPPEPQATQFQIPKKKLVAVEVLKKEMRVKADNLHRVYGDANPELTFQYNSDDFAYDENETHPDFTESLVPPNISILAKQSSNVGVYSIFLTGGSHDNYTFIRTDGSLEITQRPIDIISIDKGLPELTAKEIAKNPDAAEYVLSGSATRSQLTAENVYSNDDFKITYDAVYKSKEKNDNYTVEIRNVKLDESYEKGQNYSLRSVPSEAAGGVIHEKNVESYSIVEQPKLEYTYGEKLDLNTGKVHIDYDNGESVDVNFAQLADNNIDLQYVYIIDAISGVTVTNGDAVNVPDYTDNLMMLIPKSIYNLSYQYTDTFTVHKKSMNISVVNTESVYGDKPVFEYEYDSDDFVNGESKDSESFVRNLVSPRVICSATNKSDIGNYDVNLENAKSNNYEFTYTPGKHTIKQRGIEIKSINANIPPLTSAIIREQPGSIHRIDSAAVNEDMTLNNLVWDDSVRITYKAVYSSIEPTESYVVGIEDVNLDNSFGKSANYKLDRVPSTAGGGRIYDKEITAVEITEQPKLKYT